MKTQIGLKIWSEITMERNKNKAKEDGRHEVKEICR
jgi:hypothetical protein